VLFDQHLKFESHPGWYTYVEKRQPLVSECRDQVHQDRDGKENEVGLVVHGSEDTSFHSVSTGGAENVNATNEEEAGAEVH
jgi:hypothetical protein